ncbi:MAG: hypothetical protein AAGK32_17680 [Actinomycetota bacterium]
MVTGSDDAEGPGPTPGAELLRLDAAGTVALTVVLVAAVVLPDSLGIVAAATALVLFAIGCGAFLWAFAIGVGRSRTEDVDIAGLFLLTGSTPREVRRRFLGLLGAQVVVAVAAASIRPFTNVAFGVLAPVFGLGLQGLWAARHGRFGPRGTHATGPGGTQ